MKYLNDKNPLAVFILVIIFGWLAGWVEVSNGSGFEWFVILILAVILAKQIEILNK